MVSVPDTTRIPPLPSLPHIQPDRCLAVLPEGPEAIEGQELAGEYYEKAAPVIELQVAKGGYRLAAWLDLIVERLTAKTEPVGEL
jgi:hypothetical protein